MNTLFPSALRERLTAARLLLVTSLVAILAGGLMSGATAHAPTRHIMWMAAYLVLVAGVVQAALGLTQALLPERLPSRAWHISEWVLFNVGNAGVIAGTLLHSSLIVTIGTGLFVVALVLFLIGVHNARGGWPLYVYRAILTIVCISAVIGLVLSFAGI